MKQSLILRARPATRGVRAGLMLIVLILFSALGGTAPGHDPRTLVYDSTQGLEAAAGAATSRNWAGYLLSLTGVTDVEGSWTVPAVPATSDDRASGTWIGIGGATTGDLIQAGTAQDSRDGRPQYVLWYEALPDLPHRLQIDVKPGDTVHLSIQQVGPDLWLIHGQDLSDGQVDSHVVHYHSALSSAEWIEEAPSSLSGEVEPLADFGAVHFSSASARAGAQLLDLSQAIGISMRDRGASLATVSPTTASSFDVTFGAAN